MCTQIQRDAEDYFGKLGCNGRERNTSSNVSWKPNANFGTGPGVSVVSPDAYKNTNNSSKQNNKSIREVNIETISTIFNSRPTSDFDEFAVKSAAEKLAEVNGLEQQETLEEKEHRHSEYDRSHVDTGADENHDVLAAKDILNMLEMLLGLFTKAKREVLTMLRLDGYKRWKETAMHKEFCDLITPYEGVPESTIAKIDENTKDLLVILNDD